VGLLDNELYINRLNPGLAFNSKIDTITKNEQFLRYLPQENFKKRTSLFPNLEEYNISPANLTEQFWEENDISKKFHIVPTVHYKSKNGFVLKDTSNLDNTLLPVIVGRFNRKSL
jgi:hypothetical protein